jgi:SAM-dependent methyltransferase
MPAAQGVMYWPEGGLSASALVQAVDLPLRDSAIDRLLLVHALEVAESPLDLLSEIWRVLAPGGRLIAVVPNRRGMWARLDATPFGQGQPFSRAQVTELMRQALFTPIHWGEALYFPPAQRRVVLRTAAAWEQVGATLSLPFAGVHLIEATKQVYRPVLHRNPARRRFALAPAPALLPGNRQDPARTRRPTNADRARSHHADPENRPARRPPVRGGPARHRPDGPR